MSGLFNQASLVLVPSGYKAGKVYSQVPTSGDGDLTFTRASDATRVNSDGLIERVPYNLLQYSEDFTNGFWKKAKNGLATLTVTANQTTAPNGTNTADLISITRSATSELSAIYTLVGQGIGTFKNSIWLKAKDSSNVGKTIDLWSWENNTRGYTKITLTADWVRYEQNTTVFTGSASELFDFGLLPISYSTSTTLAVEFYAWGGQSNIGSTAKPYLATTDRLNVPRLDYSQGSCPALLLEPQRTNLVLYSEQFDNAAWVKTTATVTANTTTAPNGTLTADTLIGASGINWSSSTLQVGTNVSSSNTYTLSLYVKSLGSTTFQTSIRNNNVGGQVTVSHSINSDTWTRVEQTYTTTSTQTLIGIIFGGTDGDVAIWGAQLEEGSYATSYIPTTNATVTRLVDTFIRNNIFTNGLISASGGTWYIEINNNFVYTRDTSQVGIFIANDTSGGVSTDGLALRNNGSVSRLTINKRVATVQTQLYITTTDYVKVALKWNGTSLDVFENGVKVVYATEFTPTIMEYFGSFGGDVPKYIIKSLLFPTPLEDVDCEVLTGEIYTSYSEMATALGYTII